MAGDGGMREPCRLALALSRLLSRGQAALGQA